MSTIFHRLRKNCRRHRGASQGRQKAETAFVLPGVVYNRLYGAFSCSQWESMQAAARDLKRDSILIAAIEVFIEEGYDLASMDRIAERADASKRTVYNHFASKELLLQAVLQKVNADCRATPRITYNPKVSLESQLGAFVEQKLMNLANPQWVGMMRVLFGILGRNEKLTQQVIGSVHDPDGSVIPFLKAACKDKRLKIDDFELASAVFGSLVGGGVWWPQVFFGAPSFTPEAAFRREIVRTFLARYGTASAK